MRKFLRKSGILVWVIAAIILTTVLGSVRIGDDRLVPVKIGCIFATFPAILSQFLSFSIPLITIGLMIPAIADPGRGAGKRLGIAMAIAYASTLFSGFLTCLVCTSLFPRLLTSIQLANMAGPGSILESCFTIEMPAPLRVMTALLLSFVMGLGLSMVPRGVLRRGFIKSRAIITRLIEMIIIPSLLLHIFGIFLNLTYMGEATSAIRTLVRVVIVALILGVIILLTQFCSASLVAHRNPFKALLTMMPAYLTVLDAPSSAAIIPMTLRQTRKNGVSDTAASFTIPLCVTVHLTGSTSKILSFAFAIVLTQDLAVSSLQWVGFIFMLSITMAAAPSVPGGTIMVVTDLLSSMLGFSDARVALIIAIYIALDSFGTATNMTGGSAIALVVDRMTHDSIDTKGDSENTHELAFDDVAHLDRVSVKGVVSPGKLAESSARNNNETIA